MYSMQVHSTMSLCSYFILNTSAYYFMYINVHVLDTIKYTSPQHIRLTEGEKKLVLFSDCVHFSL